MNVSKFDNIQIYSQYMFDNKIDNSYKNNYNYTPLVFQLPSR